MGAWVGGWVDGWVWITLWGLQKGKMTIRTTVYRCQGTSGVHPWVSYVGMDNPFGATEGNKDDENDKLSWSGDIRGTSPGLLCGYG